MSKGKLDHNSVGYVPKPGERFYTSVDLDNRAAEATVVALEAAASQADAMDTMKPALTTGAIAISIRALANSKPELVAARERIVEEGRGSKPCGYVDSVPTKTLANPADTTAKTASSSGGPCSACGKHTKYACSDCRIDFQTTIYVCENCRNTHEEKCSACVRAKAKEAADLAVAAFVEQAKTVAGEAWTRCHAGKTVTQAVVAAIDALPRNAQILEQFEARVRLAEAEWLEDWLGKQPSGLTGVGYTLWRKELHDHLAELRQKAGEVTNDD